LAIVAFFNIEAIVNGPYSPLRTLEAFFKILDSVSIVIFNKKWKSKGKFFERNLGLNASNYKIVIHGLKEYYIFENSNVDEKYNMVYRFF